MYKIVSLALLMSVSVHTANAADAIRVRAIAEVERSLSEGDHQVKKLLPADRVVSGDHVIFTLEVRNSGTLTLDAPAVSYPIPKHMTYVAQSAVGPGVEVTFSVDGGREFDRPERLVILGSDGRTRPALAADYTHIHWQLHSHLKSHSVAFVRFRTIAK
jgi:uncharacterized repeat protein (TIGR01451 family)